MTDNTSLQYHLIIMRSMLQNKVRTLIIAKNITQHCFKSEWHADDER